MYSHRSNFLHAMVVASQDVMGLSSTSCFYAIVPLFHANSWGLVFAAPMTGARLVLPGQSSHQSAKSLMQWSFSCYASSVLLPCCNDRHLLGSIRSVITWYHRLEVPCANASQLVSMLHVAATCLVTSGQSRLGVTVWSSLMQSHEGVAFRHPHACTQLSQWFRSIFVKPLASLSTLPCARCLRYSF